MTMNKFKILVCKLYWDQKTVNVVNIDKFVLLLKLQIFYHVRNYVLQILVVINPF